MVSRQFIQFQIFPIFIFILTNFFYSDYSVYILPVVQFMSSENNRKCRTMRRNRRPEKRFWCTSMRLASKNRKNLDVFFVMKMTRHWWIMKTNVKPFTVKITTIIILKSSMMISTAIIILGDYECGNRQSENYLVPAVILP
ncbi:hypothetical protein Hanom_Chr03g00220261 [Helianthus anomalus]